MISRLLPIAPLLLLAHCGSPQQEIVVQQSQLHAAIEADELLNLGRKSLDFVNGVWEKIPTGTLNDLRSVACTASLGYTLKDIDSIEFTVGVDPMKYFPGVGRVVGTQANLTYSFFRSPAGGIQGQAYFTPQLKAGYTASPAEVRVGWSWGCGGNPNRRAGYFANVGIGGISAGFGVDAVAAFSEALIDKDSRPVNFESIQSKYFEASNELLAGTKSYAEKGASGASTSRYTSGNFFYSSATPESIRAAVQQADKMLFVKDLETDANVSLGAILRDHLQGQSDQQFRKSADSVRALLGEMKAEIAEKRDTALGGLLQGILESKLAEVYSTLENHVYDGAAAYSAVNVYSRAWTVDQKRLIDTKQNYLDQIQKKHGYYTMLWVKDVLDAYKLRHEGTQKLRLLVGEWMVQFKRQGYINASQTIGGIHNGPVFHGCNYVSMSPTGLSTYGRVVTAPLRVPATALRPFKMLSSITALPFRTVGSLLAFKEVVAGFAKTAGIRLNESTAGLSHAYPIPYSQWKPAQSDLPYAEKATSLTARTIETVESFFNWSCPTEPEQK